MRIPIATFRIQFHADFGFNAAKAIIAYLSDLGISDLYASPIFKARQGSLHGYDIVDPNQLNPELGTEAEFQALIAALQAKKMGWLQDIVPNHMAYDSQNTYLMDVLEHGPASEFVDYFDIDWDYAYEDINNRVLTPLLGDFYDRCLERGEIQLTYDQNGFHICYYELTLPVRIESYAQLITHDFGRLARMLDRQHPDYIKLLGILYLVKNIQPEISGQQRKDQVAFVKQILWELYQTNEEIQALIAQNLKTFNGIANEPSSFDLLDQLLCDQYYRLSFWKVGAEELNYRRFFTINELICLRIDDPKVFHQTHTLIAQLVTEQVFTGLRVDHIDGLYDPAQYLTALRQKVGDVYLIIEKILEWQEQLPRRWPVQGTVGYDFLNYVNGIFCRQENESRFNQIYRQFTASDLSFRQLFLDKKRLIAEKNLAGDVDNLARFLKRISSQYRYGRDLTQGGLKQAILEVLVAFPVYCTYINQGGIEKNDLTHIQAAIATARTQIPHLVNELNLIERFLLLEYEESLPEEERAQWLHFVMRLQQFTGPLMAKGVEDTLLYVYNRFISLNEVGGSPERFGLSLTAFHHYQKSQIEHWPHKLNATSTHDTKRSEDVRARLNVLSELPDQWESAVQSWRELNQPHKRELTDCQVPDANDEYFLYQTLVGAYPFEEGDRPLFTERVKQYVIKAVREAKVHTAWLQPDNAYEDGFSQFVDRILDPSPQNLFLPQFQDFWTAIADYGIYNSLSQTLLKIAAPGVPDFYQGTDLWDFSLVDPDNRRPVDYHQRQQSLQHLQAGLHSDSLGLCGQLLETRRTGQIKQFLILRALALRHHYRAIFEQGHYLPITVMGPFEKHIIAFARHLDHQMILAVAPRFLTDLVPPGAYPLTEKVWADTVLEVPSDFKTTWQDGISGQHLTSGPMIAVGQVLNYFPVALLVGESPD
ncbi:MAG: malto-oligosyltrehalose synthase [Synechocystis sp.]|nr:malto-oligosyltrehalose synthase [Synechocystis sp.]